MINLASSSITRAKILEENGVKFKQFSFDFDESGVDKNLKPASYVLKVVQAKKEQFLKEHPNLKNLLFADSAVVCNGKILGKAKDKKEALYMLNLQSDNEAKIITAMIFLGEEFELINISSTTYQFAKFSQDDLNEYIKSNEWQGKAGAMMIEGFNKKYILKKIGNESTARGLNIEQLKAFL
ncbi:septum formation inhibitor Maf [Campylobacter sp. RM16190]|uniref:septum formation inhibitor Maf n=1 Tax=Campylobacter sp. RM16190 TaxID=1705727 RepID=UPI001475C502|nr:septum formation inhibitor Maf [Campylobacter sp. RM16190]